MPPGYCGGGEKKKILYQNNRNLSEIKVRGTGYVPLFEYCFMLVMVAYMAQMTTATSRMVGSVGSPWIPFLLPIVLLGAITIRHRISFGSKRLIGLFAVFGLWCVLSLIKIGSVQTEDISFMFFVFYPLLAAYIIIKAFGKSLFAIYEDIMVKVSIVSLCFWLFSILLPDFAKSIFSIFPETPNGNNVLFIYHWMNPDAVDMRGQSYYLRNAGISWEPGRYAIMLVMALFFNLSRNGLYHKNPKTGSISIDYRVFVFLAAIASTISTTGVVIAGFLIVFFFFSRISVSRLVVFAVILLPVIVFVATRDFVREKIEDQLQVSSIIERYQNATSSTAAAMEDDEYAFSAERFPSLVMEAENFLDSPILGYTTNAKHSYFHSVMPNVVLTGGLMKVLAQFGILLGLFIYYILFRSSAAIALCFPHGKKWAFFLTAILCSISYPIFLIPVFTAFWLYGFFYKRTTART